MSCKERLPLADFIETWENLWDVTVHVPKRTKQADNTQQPGPDSAVPKDPVVSQDLHHDANRLGLDLIAYPYDENTVRQKRLGLSSRKFENAKRELEEKQLIWTFPTGHWRFLIAKKNLYQLFNLKIEKEFDQHTFALNLAFHHLKRDPEIDRLQKEGKVGDSGAAVDILVHLKNGLRECWEITLSVGNVSSNCAKLDGMGFSRIVFLCRDHKVQQAAWAHLRQSGLPPNLLAKVRCILFSTLLKKYRAIGAGE